MSGGKDSIYGIREAILNGHRVVALVHVAPASPGGGDAAGGAAGGGYTELDSMMFQSIGSSLLPAIAQCMQLPLYTRATRGLAADTSAGFDGGGQLAGGGGGADEVEDLFLALSDAAAAHPTATGVLCGALASTYQRARVEAVAARARLTPVSFLWGRAPARLVCDMARARLRAVIARVAAYGLTRAHVGVPLPALAPRLLADAAAAGLNAAGEGGEYETVTLDCPGVYAAGALELPGARVVGPGRCGVGWHLVMPAARVAPKGASDAAREAEELRREREGRAAEGVEGAPALPPREAVGEGGGGGGEGGGGRRGAPPVAVVADAPAAPRPPRPEPVPFFAPPAVETRGAGDDAARASGKVRETVTLSPSAAVVGVGGDVVVVVQGTVAVSGDTIALGGLVVTTRSPAGVAAGSAVSDASSSAQADESVGPAAEAAAADAADAAALLAAADAALRRAGAAGLEDACFVTLALARLSSFEAVNAAFARAFAGSARHPPARVALQAAPRARAGAGAPPPRVALSLSLVAAAGSGAAARAGRGGARATLHVRTLSGWAPLAVGPYAQAVAVGGGLAWPAGAIGLRPETMRLVGGGRGAQLARALTSLARVLAATGTGASVPRALAIVVFVAATGDARADNAAAAEAVARARAWVVGMYGRGLDGGGAGDGAGASAAADDDDGRVRLADVDDFGGDGGEGDAGAPTAEPALPPDAPSAARGLDNAGEGLYELTRRAHVPPAYVRRMHGALAALAEAQATASAAAAGDAGTTAGGQPPPTLPAEVAAVLPVTAVVVDALPRGAAVEVEAWGPTDEADELLGGASASLLSAGGASGAVHALRGVALAATLAWPAEWRSAEGGPQLHELTEACRAVRRALEAANLPVRAMLTATVLDAGDLPVDFEDRLVDAWGAACGREGGAGLAVTVLAASAVWHGRVADRGVAIQLRAWDTPRLASELWLRCAYEGRS